MATCNIDLKKEKYWREIIGRQSQSGKSPSQFCKDEGLVDNQFYYWRSNLANRQKVKKQIKPVENKLALPFVPLTVPDNFDFNIRQNTEQIEISKIVLRISANTDQTTIACILQSLGA